MLTAEDLDLQFRRGAPRRKRSLPSIKQQYHEYIMQRIEDYKNSLSRGELLRLGDEAAHELQGGTSGQLLLTEVLMQETVDEHIKRRLNLPTLRRWRSRIQPLRRAQRDPNHWQIDRTDPVAVVLPRLEPGDRALVVGSGAERATYLLAAHDIEVICLFEDSATADKVEDILASESLGARCSVYVVALGQWLPPLAPVHLVVVDAGVVEALTKERQRTLLGRVQTLTTAEGVHAVVSGRPGSAAEGCLHHYPDWVRLPLPDTKGSQKGAGLRGVLLAGPPARDLSHPAAARPAV